MKNLLVKLTVIGLSPYCTQVYRIFSPRHFRPIHRWEWLSPSLLRPMTVEVFYTNTKSRAATSAGSAVPKVAAVVIFIRIPGQGTVLRWALKYYFKLTNLKYLIKLFGLTTIF